MKTLLLLLVAGLSLSCTAGCGSRPRVQSFTVNAGAILDMADPSCYTIRNGEFATIKLVEKSGCAALQFGDWTLVFEAIPAQSVFNRGIISDSGSKTVQVGDFRLSLPDLDMQSLKQVTDSFSVNGYDFKFTDGQKRLVFADQTYESGPTPKTIVISKDGATREQVNE